MFSRRTFLAAGAATLATPAIVRAQGFRLDPIYMPQSVRVSSSLQPQQIIVAPQVFQWLW